MLMFLQSVGEAIVARGMKGLMGIVPLGNYVHEIAVDAIDRYRERKRMDHIQNDLQECLQADLAEVRAEANRIASEVAAGHSEAEIRQLAACLSQVPAVARQSLKRPDDPTGTTVPSFVDLSDPGQFANLLPRRAPKFQVGQTVPEARQWVFEQLLGSGGFGEVWLARHSFLGKPRAFKFCLDEMSRERLLRHEGEIVKRVMAASVAVRDDEHGIVPLVDAYLEGKAPWLAYDYVEGGDLASLVSQMATLPGAERAQQALRFLADLAAVVGQFHVLPLPIIHRDLKPANVLLKQVGDRWFLRITDFGISHVTADRAIADVSVATPNMNLGETFRGAHTPMYASPQQKKGHKPDVRDDVHALGIIGFQLMLGDLTAERPAGKWRKRVSGWQVSDEILDLLESCWDDTPEERPGDAHVLAQRLNEMLSPENRDDWADVIEDYRSYLHNRLKGNGTRVWLEERANRFNRWQKCAQNNCVEAMALIGDCAEEGIGCAKDYTEAMKWYRKAADSGNAAAMNWIATLYDFGHGVKQDYIEAMKWHRKAAEAGDIDAMGHIGMLYDQGQGVDQDYTEAMKWYRKAANAGCAYSMDNIGRLYQNGEGVDQDDTEAMKWYRRAANAGNASAMDNIGSLYRDGEGVDQDYSEAMKWYRKANDAGDSDAMLHIGGLYRNGEGVVEDHTEGAKWYRKAAEAGNSTAMNELGTLYQDGSGVKQNYAEAMKWYQKAAEADGNVIAMNNIGDLYENGYGVPKDIAKAIEWYQKSAEAGDADAVKALKRLRGK